MHLFFYDYPFLFFKAGSFCFGFKPFVPLFVAYFLVSFSYLCKSFVSKTKAQGSNKNRLKQFWDQLKQQRGERLTKGEKGFIIAYPALLPLYLFQLVSGGGKTFLTELAENYLHYETLLFFFALILRWIWRECPAPLWKRVQMLDWIVGLMVVTAVFATIITCQVETLIPLNIICFFFLGSLVFTLEYSWRKRCPSSPVIENKDIFRPVETYAELLPQQQRIADEIIAMICSNCAESSASICVSGEWGVGKTSVVNGAIDELRRRNRGDGKRRQDEYIYINAMELDTVSSLFDYFFSRIRDILKKRGAYVGFGSAYQKFISSSIGKITDPSIAAILETKLFPSSDDYRERLKSLEESIYAALDRDMILVIVDDVERCEEKKAKSFIAFIKEIATMRGIVTIFITDFKYLSAPQQRSGQSGTDETEKESGFYYNKFFNYRISVPPIDAEEFMRKQDVDAKREKIQDRLGLRRIGELFLEFKRKLDLADQKHQEKLAQNGENSGPVPHINKMDWPGNLFGNMLGLSRTLVKFYRSLDQTLELLDKQYLQSNHLDDDAKAYFKSIHLDEVLFFLTYVRACMPNECSCVIEQGLGYFEQKDAEVSAHHRLVIALGEGLLYYHSLFMGIMSQSYHQSKAWQFVLICLQGKLPESVKSFNSKEEEWVTEIEKDNFQLMEEHWPDMVSAVAQTFAWRDPARGEKCLNKLFSFAHEKLINGEWELKNVFRIFDHQWRNEETFSQKIPVLKLFWKQFSDVLSNATQGDIQLLEHFATIYLWHCAGSITRAACLFVPYESVRDKMEAILLGEKPEGEKLDTLLNWLFPSVINLELPPMEDAFMRLDALADEAEAFLTEKHLDGLGDMKDIVTQLRLSTEEFRYLEKIKQKIVRGKVSRADGWHIQDVESGKIDSIIEYFLQLANSNKREDTECLRSELQIFFDRLLRGEEPLSEKQYQSLQEILTCCIVDIYGRVPMRYRMILAEHWELGKTGGAPNETAENANHEDAGLCSTESPRVDADSQRQQPLESSTL